MKPGDLRKGDDPATWRGLDVSGLGTVVVERLVRTHGVVVGNVGAQKPVEMSFVQDKEMIEAVAADGADHSLHEGILPGCARGGEDLADAHALDSPRELLAVNHVSITEQEPRSGIVRERLDDLSRCSTGDIDLVSAFQSLEDT
jgi:hypothetical protein